MKTRKPYFKASLVGLALSAALLGTLTGCVGYVDGPSAEVGTTFVAQDDYVYYPRYEYYYSVSRHQYAYREGNAWVSRPAPRGVPENVLRASPSVKMNFHDSPAQITPPWSSNIQKTGNLPVPGLVKTGRMTNATIITADNRTKLNHSLKGILC